MNKYIYISFAIISLNVSASEIIISEKKIHTDSIDSLCIKKDKIYSVSFDHTLKRTERNSSVVIGRHNDWIRKVICSDSNIITASNDGFISIWSDSKKIHSVRAHSWWITDIALSQDRLVSVSLDETVKVWSYPALKLLYSHKLYGSRKHYSVVINNGKAFIGSTFGYMFVLDLNKYKWKKKGAISSPYSIPISSVKIRDDIFFGTSDGYIIRVKGSSPFNVSRKKISKFAIKALTADENSLYIGDDDGVLRKTNFDNWKKVDVLINYPESVRALVIKGNNIYAGYDNGYLRIFNKNIKKESKASISPIKNKNQ